MCQPGKVNVSWNGQPRAHVAVRDPVADSLPEEVCPLALGINLPPHSLSRAMCLRWPEHPITLHGPPALLCRWLQWFTHAEGLTCLPHLTLYNLPTADKAFSAA